ncbi:protein SPT2 homolog isoform X1 [Fopius arisanus]|uniref:Protein SPT2 homolog n=2 Tax=Fopius arisanus TaxID=64838 RepID=A0A0C9QGM6_9HYME|nr:PREDICTED: protein SPT2 homolog isoform X1 [Fopius arisanus]
MDFGELLTVAQKNSANKQRSSYSYPAKFTPPKKESKQSKALSDNIKRFLAKKEEEERQKALEEKRKKENLLALRDHKAQSRINKHLKVCKAANKSVIADAVNHENTAVTMAGPSQPDEDDYGYVSQEASAFYNKLMSKYSNLPSEKPLFSESGKKPVKDIASTKDRVKQALKQQELEEGMPHRRKRKSSGAPDKDDPREKDYSTDRDRDRDRSDRVSEKEDKPKPKKRASMPPPMDFVALLKLAEKKQHEPLPIEIKPKPKLEEPERLMTKRQMKEYQKEREWKEKKERAKNGEIPKAPTASITSTSSTDKSNDKFNDKPKPVPNRIPKLTNGKNSSSILERTLTKSINPVSKKVPDRLTEKPSPSPSKSSEKDAILEERRKLEAEKREIEMMRKKLEEERRLMGLGKGKSNEESRNKLVKVNGKMEKGSGSSKDVRPRQVPPSSVKPRQFPPSDVRSRQFPPGDVKPRQFPPSDVRPRQFPPGDVRGARPNNRPMKNGRPINKRRIFDDDEDEYDSELDDFIDDGPQEGAEDYSKYISEIFGYDKSRYSALDDDDDNMESNYAQQLKEEFVSTKIGIMEDLEDMKQEALEKKRKLLQKKKVKK